MASDAELDRAIQSLANRIDKITKKLESVEAFDSAMRNATTVTRSEILALQKNIALQQRDALTIQRKINLRNESNRVEKQNIDNSVASIASATALRDANTNMIALKQAESVRLQESIATATQEKTAKEETLSYLERERDGLRSSLEMNQRMAASYQKRIDDGETLNKAELGNFENFKSRSEELQEKLKVVSNSYTKESLARQDIIGNLVGMNSQLGKVQTEIGELETANVHLTDSINQSITSMAASAHQVERNEQKLKKHNDELEKINKQLQKLQFEEFTKTVNSAKELFLKTGNALRGLQDKIYALQKELGVTFGTAVQTGAGAMLNQVTSLFSEGPALSFQDTINAVNAYQKEFGTLLTRGAAQEFAKEAKKFGTDINTYAKAQRSFLTSGVQAANTQQKFITQFKAAGLTANQAFEFAAQNADLVAIAGNKYADSLARAAANATKIGVSLSKTEQFADNLVGDFEGGIEKFSELQAMGFSFDINKLMETSATGTAEDIQKELGSQLAGNQAMLKELQRNRFARIQLQQATGLGMADIEKLAGVATLPTAETKKEEGPEGGLLQTLTKFGTGVGLVASTSATVLNTAATIANTMALARLSITNGNLLNPKNWLTLIKGKAPTGGGGIGGEVASVASKIKPPTMPTGGLGGGGGGLTNVASGTSAFSGNNILKGAAAMLIVAASVWVLAKGLQQFNTVNWGDMGKAALALGVLAGAAFGLSFIAPQIAVGAFAIAALGASIIPFAFAMRLMAPGLVSFSQFINTLAQLNAGQVGILGLMGPALASMAVGLTALGIAAIAAAPGLAILGGLQKLGILPTMGGGPTPSTNALPVSGKPVEGVATSNTTAATTTTATKLDTSRLEGKLDQVITAIKSMKIQMNGHDVANISLNDRSPLYTASPARVAG